MRRPNMSVEMRVKKREWLPMRASPSATFSGDSAHMPVKDDPVRIGGRAREHVEKAIAAAQIHSGSFGWTAVGPQSQMDGALADRLRGGSAHFYRPCAVMQAGDAPRYRERRRFVRRCRRATGRLPSHR